VEYAGANRPLWIVRKGSAEIEEIKATKVAIGGYTEDEQVFTKHTIDLQKGDSVYIFSDGYADQFSPQDKKLMTRKFKEILLSIQDKTMEEQKQFLGSFIEDWRGDMEQTDDILVIGVRV
jgi:serine phosphatase RsbU (regulator of sigma subunit)